MKFLSPCLSLFLVLGLFCFGSVAQASSPVVTQPAAEKPGPGAGRTVTEVVGGGSATVRYEGLHEGATKSGARWRKVGDEWSKDGTWQMDGKDIDVYTNDGKQWSTNQGMANASSTSGLITGEVDPSFSGTWAD